MSHIKLILNRFEVEDEINISVTSTSDSAINSLSELEKSIVSVKNTLETTISNIQRLKTDVGSKTNDYVKNLSTSVSNIKKINLKDLSNAKPSIFESRSFNKPTTLETRESRGVDKQQVAIEKELQSLRKDSAKYLSDMAKEAENVYKSSEKTANSLRETNAIGSRTKASGFKVDLTSGLRTDKFKDLQEDLDTSTNSVIGRLISSFRGLTSGVKENSDAVENNDRIVKNGAKSWDGYSKTITTSLVRLRIWTGFLKGVGRSVYNLYQSAAAYEESLNLYRVSLGQFDDEGQEWATKISNALYLDPSNVLQYTGAFQNLVEGLGVGSKAAYTMSTNLTQLVYDMSSYLNISEEAAYTKLQSAIIGQSRAIASTGVAMQNASLEELAYSLGIKKSVREMTQAEKTYLRYIQIIRQTTNMQGDLARTIVTPANAMRVLQNQFQMLGRAVGRVFTPIIMTAIPYVIALTNALSSLANKLAELLGFKFADIDYDSLEKGSKAVTNLGDSAQDAGKKVKNMSAPFDDLNVVLSESSGDESSSALLNKLNGYVDGYDMLQYYTEQFEDQIDTASENLKKLGTVLGLVFGAVGLAKLLKYVGAVGKLALGFKDATGAASNLSTFSLSALKTGGVVIGVIASIGAYIWALPTSIKALSKQWESSFSQMDSAAKPTKTLVDELAIALSTSALGNGALTRPLLEGLGLLTAGLQDSVKEVSVFDDSISKTTKKKLTPLVEQFKQLDKTVMDLKLTDKIISKSDVDTIKSQLHEISTSITNELSADENENLKNINLLENFLDKSTYNGLLESTKTYYTDQKKLVDTNEKEILDIINNAKTKNRSLTEEEFDRISELRSSTLDAGLQAMTETDEEFQKLRIRIGEETNKMNVKQASEYIKTAADTRDKAIKNAEEQYVGIVAQAERLRDAGAITDEEYNSMVVAAKLAKEQTVGQAQEQYDDINKKTREGLGENAKYIDEKTGEIRSNWSVFFGDLKEKAKNGLLKIGTAVYDWWNNTAKPYLDDHVFKYLSVSYWTGKFNNLIKTVKGKLAELGTKFSEWKAELKTPHIKWDSKNGYKASGTIKKVLDALNLPTSIPKLKVDWYANGGYPTSGDLFFANENGMPEFITSIGNRSAVANQDQMVSAFTNAFLTGISSLRIPNQQGDTIVYIGNDKVYQGQGEYQNRQSDRYGTTRIVKV